LQILRVPNIKSDPDSFAHFDVEGLKPGLAGKGPDIGNPPCDGKS
jgi:hypothetical protein